MVSRLYRRAVVFLLIFAASGILTYWGYRAAERAPYGAGDQFYGVWRGEEIDRSPVGVDDANIFFVYSRNLADGHGLVWNVGGERVEGYSSALWVAIGAIVFKLGLSIEIALLVLSVTLIATTLSLLVFELDAHLRPYYDSSTTLSAAGMMVAIWSLAVPGYLVWSGLSLMETGLWSAILIAATVVVLAEIRNQEPGAKHRWTMAGLIVALLLARPEGMLWAMFFALLYSGVILVRDRRTPVALKSLALLVATYVTAIGVLTAFRLAYFGYPLPNTYYAKISPSLLYNLETGSGYLLQFMGSNPLLWLLVPTAAVAAAYGAEKLRGHDRQSAGPGRRTDIAIVAVSLVVLLGIAVPVLVGGDHFVLYRFFQPVWPLIVVPAILLAARLIAPRLKQAKLRGIAALRVTGLLAFVFAVGLLNDVSWSDLALHDIQIEFRYAQLGRETGKYMNEAFASGPLPAVGVILAGGFRYRYEGEVVDLMGLNLTEMAHQPGDRHGFKNHAAFNPEVFYRLQPELLLPWLVPSLQQLPPYYTFAWFVLPLKGMQNEERFRELYALAVIRPKTSPTEALLSGLFRRDFLKELASSDAFDIFFLKPDAPVR